MRIAAALLIAALLAGDALAEPLARGQAAGLAQAQSAGTVSTIALGGLGLFGAILALQSGGGQNLTAISNNNAVAPVTTV